MKLHQLHALVGVVEYGGIRAAARAMHLTQAALTKSLRQLEEDHGVALLIRKPSGVSLTDAGQRLHARAQLVVRQLDLASEELEQAKGQDGGMVRVGLTPYLMLSGLGKLFTGSENATREWSCGYSKAWSRAWYRAYAMAPWTLRS